MSTSRSSATAIFIRSEIGRQRYNLLEISHLAEIDHSQLVQFLKGNTTLSRNMAVRLAVSLGMEPAALYAMYAIERAQQTALTLEPDLQVLRRNALDRGRG